MFNFFRRRGAQRSPAHPLSPDDAAKAVSRDAVSGEPAGAPDRGGAPGIAQAVAGSGASAASAALATPAIPAASAAAAPAAADADTAADAGNSAPPGAPPSGNAPPPNSPPPSRADTPPPRGLALDEITRGMQHAAAAANQLLAHQYTAVLDQFFDQDEDGLLSPRIVELALDAEHTMPVPLVALATPRGLALDRMVVHLTVRADFTEALPAGGLAGGDQRGRFFVTLAPPSARKDAQGQEAQRDTQHIDIEMQFTALAPPEAIMRVIDEYTHRLVPRKRHDEPEKSHG